MNHAASCRKRIEIIRGDITTVNTDAIVNAANSTVPDNDPRDEGERRG